MTEKKESAAVEKPPAKRTNYVMRDGKCLTCGQEWTARTGQNAQPSRCPVCHSRDVKWLDECTLEERQIGVIGARNLEIAVEPVKEPEPEPVKAEPEPTPEPVRASSKKKAAVQKKTAAAPKVKQPAKTEPTDYKPYCGMEECEEEYNRQTGGFNPKFIVFAFFGILVVGGIFLCYKRFKKHNRQTVSEDTEKAAAKPTYVPIRTSIGPLPPLYGGIQ